MSIYQNFAPTILYIKRHSITGKLYFGKTSRLDIKYDGSGTHWVRHIDMHGRQYVETIWRSEVFTDPRIIEDFALFFSEFYDIVKSSQWLNKVVENGLDGQSVGFHHSIKTKERLSNHWRGVPKSQEHTAKMRASLKGVPKSEEHCRAISESTKTRKKAGPVSEETRAKMRAAASRREAAKRL